MKKKKSTKNESGIKPKIVVILGPTASGKSDLAVQLAKKYNGEVISADSRQVYKGLNIGTGKITKSEMKGIPHHLLDVANPKQVFTIVNYRLQAEKAISEIMSRGKLPIICGGTGFYIQALVDGITLPDVPANPKLRKSLAKLSSDMLFAKLKKLDPERASNIDKHNARRLIRAIEIAEALGAVPKIKKQNNYNALFIGLAIPPEELRARIEKRLLKRLKLGMIEEAKKLHAHGLTFKRMHELGLEYRYLALYLQKKISKEELTTKLNAEIWQYARRQMTWFRKDKRIKWIELKEIKTVKGLAKKFIYQTI